MNSIKYFLLFIVFLSVISCNQKETVLDISSLYTKKFNVIVDSLSQENHFDINNRFLSKKAVLAGDNHYQYLEFNVYLLEFTDYSEALIFFKNSIEACDYEFILLFGNKLIFFENISGMSRYTTLKLIKELKAHINDHCSNLSNIKGEPRIYMERTCY